MRVNGKHYPKAPAPMAELGILLDARSVHPGLSARSNLLALARPAARLAAWRPLRAPLALALALAAPATSRLPALTTGLRGTGTAISFPHGFVTALTGGTP